MALLWVASVVKSIVNLVVCRPLALEMKRLFARLQAYIAPKACKIRPSTCASQLRSVRVCLFLVLALHICVSEISNSGTNQEHPVHGDTHTGASVGSTSWTSGDLVGSTSLWLRVIRASLQVTHNHAIEDLACFVAVTDIFKGFGCILATDV
jgi:hypothetical protein